MQAVYRSYYTKSNTLVNYMVDMLSVKPGMHIFEPCAGDGVFIDAINKKVGDTCIDANELNPDAFSLLKRKPLSPEFQIWHRYANGLFLTGDCNIT